MFQAVRCVWVKRFYTNTLLVFCPAWGSSPLKIFYISFHSINKTKNVNPPWLFKLGELNNRYPAYQFLKFILGCTFTLYGKNVRKIMTKCSLKTAEVLLHADENVLTFFPHIDLIFVVLFYDSIIARIFIVCSAIR